ncbi:MAG TPA: pyridoxal-phosphate dependent enzyme [Planctomycetota bacterium]|nr:pyridoxal-phosphate dependent enzyme [Planctomycetota bacterium]
MDTATRTKADARDARWPQISEAASRLAGVALRTPLVAFDSGDDRVELRLKLECQQLTGSFKARGAWNQIAQLSAAERAAGVVTVSSGNHGKALSWAAQKAGVRACVVMPANSYPNKIEACREFGAEVVLGKDRDDCEVLLAERVKSGATLVHPYDAERTLQGAGTVGWEIALDWPEVEVVCVCVGGGGLVAGTVLALRQRLGNAVQVLGVEPEGAPTLTRAMAEGKPVFLREMPTEVQGLCPPYAGAVNTEICLAFLDGTVLLSDEEIFAAQRELVTKADLVVEPAGAAAFAAVRSRKLPPRLLAGRSRANPLRVAVTVSGGNPDPAQLASLRAPARS